MNILKMSSDWNKNKLNEFWWSHLSILGRFGKEIVIRVKFQENKQFFWPEATKPCNVVNNFKNGLLWYCNASQPNMLELRQYC